MVTITVVNDIFEIIGSVYRYTESSLKVYEVDMQWATKSDNLNIIINTLPVVIIMIINMSIESKLATDGLLARLNKIKFVAAFYLEQVKTYINLFEARVKLDLIFKVSPSLNWSSEPFTTWGQVSQLDIVSRW